jgi:hypothetical protein
VLGQLSKNLGTPWLGSPSLTNFLKTNIVYSIFFLMGDQILYCGR